MRCFQSPMAVDASVLLNCPITIQRIITLHFCFVSQSISSMQNTIHFVVLNTFVVLIVLVMVWPTPSRLRQQQEVMAGTGIWRCNACFFSWAPMKVPCSVNLKVNNATRKTRRFNRVDLPDTIYHSFMNFNLQSESQSDETTDPSSSTRSHFRHPKEGHFNSHRVKPPLSAQRTQGGPR